MSVTPVYLLNSPVHIDFTGGITPKGEYSALTDYVLGDSVSYQNSSYVAIQATTGNVPTNTTFWQLMARGFGPQGAGVTETIYLLGNVSTDGSVRMYITGNTVYMGMRIAGAWNDAPLLNYDQPEA